MNPRRVIASLLLGLAVILWTTAGCSTTPHRADAAKVEIESVREKANGEGDAITQQQLQTSVMRFADHYASRLLQAFSEVEEKTVPTDTWRIVFEDVLFSTHAAYTIAADPNPSIAMLDMGSSDGVAVGDEYVLVVGDGDGWPGVVAGRLQVVRVEEETASARLVKVFQPEFRTGLQVRLDRKMR